MKLLFRWRRVLSSWFLRGWFWLQRFLIDLNQNHHEILVRGAALVRSPARDDHEIALLDLESLAVDNPRAAPLARVSLLRILKLSAQNESGGTFQHIVDIVRRIVQFRQGAGPVFLVLNRHAQLHAAAVNQL